MGIETALIEEAIETGKAVRAGAASSVDRLASVNIHYTRKENQLFPHLEKHGITGPSKVMWGIHDEIRAMLKAVQKAVDESDVDTIRDMGPKLSRAIVEMEYKERNILFHGTQSVEWRRVGREPPGR